MKALFLKNGWCTPGTVADTILFGKIEPPPTPTKDYVLIDVKATSINVDDVALCQDSAGGGWFFHGKTPTSAEPFIGGSEYAGVVRQVGPKVKRLKVGDVVCGVQDIAMSKSAGTWAEQTLAPESHVIRIPDGCDITFMEAAASVMAVLLSGDMYQRAKLDEVSQKRCLVVGASGGLGTFLMKLLQRHKNVNVVAVCSGKHSDKMKRLGATEVVDYAHSPFEEQLKDQDSFDVVFDFVGGTDVEYGGRKVLKRGGKFITGVGPRKAIGDRVLSCSEWYGWAFGLLWRIVRGCFVGHAYEMAGAMPPVKEDDFIRTVVDTGARPEIALEVSWEEDALREAIRKVASRHTGGKVVINIEPNGGGDERAGE
mmetsp:Transcript_885/g.1250  ORF Transcript_885/g.1250 Transcript_885/m.1250 type:complete len:368 (+) Transcript_885:62-1165(+)